ncbi:UNVERIFIED_CONTAM: Indole-3-acetic acid-induced protein ARG7 [Sesamum radiatum]|uniref:Indole-3-acetic acid-induced protein ARG7 n=2 Tax=Sesamum TaxID=4181 RepID=A0AAW2KMW1_SESRA
MDENGGSRVIGIRQIVRLKGLLQKWQHVTLGPKVPRSGRACGGISPAVSRRLRSSNVYCDSDEDSCQSPEPPHDVPRGYLAVYVGPELRRFIIPTSYLTDPLFKVLLEKVEEEFGFDHSGGLTIPCETETFKYLIQCIENHQKEQADRNAG